MSRYIHPYTDFGFKKLFGEEGSKDLLIDFLNTMLPEKHQIADLSFKDKEQVREVQEFRSAFFDIYCTASTGEEFIVEIQRENSPTFRERALYYAYTALRIRVQRGVKWEDMKFVPIYVVAIMDYVFEDEEASDDEKLKQKLYYDVKFKDQDNDLFFRGLNLKFVQMPLFNKTEKELENHFEKWLYFLKHLPELEKIPMILKEPVFEHAFDIAEISNLSPDAFLEYERSWRDYIDTMGAREFAKEKATKEGRAEGLAEGRAEGRAEGMQQGMQQGILKVAKTMKEHGLSVEIIVQSTGLSSSEIEKL